MPYFLLCRLAFIAVCCLVQGQSTHLSFIVEFRHPPVSGADFSANADEHVATAKIKTFAPYGYGFFFSQDVFRMKMCLYIFCLSSVFYQHSVSQWMDSAVHKSHWPWQKELTLCNTAAYQCPFVALRCDSIGQVFWILMAFISNSNTIHTHFSILWLIT